MTTTVKTTKRSEKVELQTLQRGEAFLDVDGDPGFRVSEGPDIHGKIMTLVYYDGVWIDVDVSADEPVLPIDAEVSFRQ